MSVTPSAALTQNRSGGVQPVAVSFVISACSNSTSTCPDQSRTVVTGGVSTVDAASMKYSMVSDMVTMWSSSSSVTLAKPEPSRPTRHTVRRYGSSSTSPEAVKYTHPLGLVDVQDLPHRPLPGGDLPEQLAGAQVVSVEVAPAVPLRVPQHLVGQHPHERRLERPLVGLDTGGPGLSSPPW